MKTLILESSASSLTCAFASPGMVWGSATYSGCESAEGIIAVIKDFLSGTKSFLQMPCLISLHSERSIVRFAKLPKMKAAELAGAVDELYKKQYPPETSRYVFGAHRMYENEKEIYFATVAIPPDVADMWQEICAACGVKLKAIRSYEICTGLYNASKYGGNIFVAGQTGDIINLLYSHKGRLESLCRLSTDPAAGKRELRLAMSRMPDEDISLAVLYGDDTWLHGELEYRGLHVERANSLDYLQLMW